MFATYILQSEIFGKYYVGSCGDIALRLSQHNAGRVRATKYGIPWRVAYKEEFGTRQDAYRREVQIKRYKGGEAFRKLLGQ